jgi:hypothetical protein
LANKNPKAEDFMEVSIAMVREVISPNPVALGRKYPISPPTKCKRMQEAFLILQVDLWLEYYRMTIGSQQMPNKTMTYLQRPSSIDDRLGNLSDGTGNQKTSGSNTNDWGEWKNLLDKVGEEFVGRHTDSNRCQNNLYSKKMENTRFLRPERTS